MKHTTSPLAPEPTSAGGKDDSTEGPEGVTEQDVEDYLKEVGPPTPHLHRDCAHPAHICTGTALTPVTSAPGLPQVVLFKNSAIETLLGLLESVTDARIPKQIMEAVDYSGILKRLEQKANEEENERSEGTSGSIEESEAFSLLVLYTSLMNFDSSKAMQKALEDLVEEQAELSKQPVDKGKKPRKQTLKNLRKDLGGIEIVRDGNLERVYFRRLDTLQKTISLSRQDELLKKVLANARFRG